MLKRSKDYLTDGIEHMHFNALIPELYCSDFHLSLTFYTEMLGFSISYMRAQERFAFLQREGAQLMIEQTVPPDRAWIIGGLQPPFGRGVNLQIRTKNIHMLYEKCKSQGATIFLPLEEKWYQIENRLTGNLQFIVLDPDNYLLRFFENLGEKRINESTIDS